MDDLRVQIVNYRTKPYLLVCLESVFKDLAGSKLDFTVAVLDNASGDDLSDLPRRFSGKPLEVLQNSRNVGFAAGHNLLAKNGNAKYLLLLNPDVEIIESNTIERLVDSAEARRAKIAGLRLITGKGATQHWDHAELHGSKARLAVAIGQSYWQERKEVGEAAWVCAAVFLIRKESFDRLGGFDENFFLYKEEEDLCLRLFADGGRVIYDPSITVLHHGGVVAKKSQYMRASADYFLKKHFHGRIGYPVFWVISKLISYDDGY